MLTLGFLRVAWQGFEGLVRPGAGMDAKRVNLSGRAQGRTRAKLRHAGAQRARLRNPAKTGPVKICLYQIADCL